MVATSAGWNSVMMFVVLVPGLVLAAQSDGENALQIQLKSSSSSPAPRLDAAPLARSTAENAVDEQRVLEFVRQHQPELYKLLRFMKVNQKPQYAQAMRETSRSVQRLENLQDRDQPLYAVELALWKIRSQLTLIAAELSVADKGDSSPTATKKLENLVQQEAEQDVVRLKLQRERVARQLEKIDAQIREQELNRMDSINRSLQQWLNRISRASRRNQDREGVRDVDGKADRP